MNIAERATIVHKYYSIELDLKRPVSNTDFEVVEGDTENYITVTLKDEGVAVDLTGCRVVAVFSHSGGSASQDSADPDGAVSVDENIISIHLKTGSVRRGPVECELRIYGENPLHLSTTPTFNFNCRPSLVTDNTVASDVQYDMLSGLIHQATEAINLAGRLPRLHIMYAHQNPVDNPLTVITSSPSDYMGIFYGEQAEAPRDAGLYTWCNITGAPAISNAEITESGELVFNMANNSSVAVSNMGDYITSAVNKKGQISSATISSKGELTLTLSDSVTVSTDNFNQHITSKLNAATEKLQERNICLKDVTVAVEAFTESDLVEGFPFMASIQMQGVTSSHCGNVIFSAVDSLSGNFAPVAVAGNGTVAVFARTLPQSDITIPVIMAERMYVNE